MNALILAAGRGERMRPLTDSTPKCLLLAGGKPLIAWHLEALRAAGCHRIVINHAWLGEQIEASIGDGARFGVRVRYSPEGTALETAGGIAKALALVDATSFMVVNGDIFTDFDFSALQSTLAEMAGAKAGTLAHLVLVSNPSHNPRGDFGLRDGRVNLDDAARLTYCGIGVYRRELFKDIVPGTRAALAPLLRVAIAQGRVSGHRHEGMWLDVGTPERLALADQIAKARLT